MGFFTKKRVRPMPSKTQSRGNSQAEIGPAEEALAGVVRTLGRYTVQIEAPNQEDFSARCEAWALHLLRGSPAPVGPELPNPRDANPGARRAFADLRQFVERRRTVEQSFLNDSLGELRATLIELVARLRKAATEDSGSADTMTGELEVLAEAVDTMSFAELKAQVGRSVDVVGRQLEAQKDRRNSRLTELGEQLRQMRTDLYKAQGEARRDALTGLDNRKCLDESLERYVALAEASGEPLTIVMADLDHFKLVNDTYGHQGGDEVLKAASNFLVRCFLRKCDLVCRYGGEEFCILLPSTPAAQAEKLTERLLDSFRNHRVEFEGRKIAFTGSAGIAELRSGETGATLLGRADETLYTAKKTGRDRVLTAD